MQAVQWSEKTQVNKLIWEGQTTLRSLPRATKLLNPLLPKHTVISWEMYIIGNFLEFSREWYLMVFVKCGWSEYQNGTNILIAFPLWYGYLTSTLLQILGSVWKLWWFHPFCYRGRNTLMFLQAKFDFFDHTRRAVSCIYFNRLYPSWWHKLLTTQITCKMQPSKSLLHS